MSNYNVIVIGMPQNKYGYYLYPPDDFRQGIYIDIMSLQRLMDFRIHYRLVEYKIPIQ